MLHTGTTLSVDIKSRMLWFNHVYVLTGYNWCVDAIKASSHSLLASDLEINKAVMFLKQKELSQAADALRAFEKKETKVASAAATNLAFIHFLVS
jgi:hypothetical protein